MLEKGCHLYLEIKYVSLKIKKKTKIHFYALFVAKDFIWQVYWYYNLKKYWVRIGNSLQKSLKIVTTAHSSTTSYLHDTCGLYQQQS